MVFEIEHVPPGAAGSNRHNLTSNRRIVVPEDEKMTRIFHTVTTGLLLCMLSMLGVSNSHAANCSISTVPSPANITAGGSVEFTGNVGGKPPRTMSWDFPGGSPSSAGNVTTVSVSYASAGTYTATLNGQDGKGGTCQDSVTVTVTGGGINEPPVCVIDTPASDVQILVGDTVDYSGTASDDDGTVDSVAWTFEGGAPASSAAEDPGLVTYATAGVYTTTFDATDNLGATCQPPDSRTITVSEPGQASPLPNQTDYKIMMNYELGMHCTGFEFAYCCVLPVYNSILAQVVKPQNGLDFPKLLESTPNANTSADVLGRQTVLREKSLDANGEFSKYVLRYWHDAQPRNDGRGKSQASTLISNVEGNSLLAWNTVADAADLNPDGSFVTGTYNGATNVVLGNGSYEDTGAVFGVPIDNYQNVVWNHLYIYEVSAAGVEGHKPNPASTAEADKYRLGLHVDYPTNFGPAGHGMEGLLTFSGENGTVVYTQMKVLEDLPVMLTSPRIWEALGLPLTPFEDSIDFFGDPGLVDEDSVRPYVQMKAELHHAVCDGAGNCTEGDVVLDTAGNPVQGFGTAPIDIPNCERCHSAFDTPNSPNVTGTPEAALVQEEIDFWKAYYPSMATGSDWYARLKGAAVSILSRHDTEHGTSFLAAYPGNGTLRASSTCAKGNTGATCVLHADCDTAPGAGDGQCDIPQNTRAGHESVICQKCHADNVIAVVKSANCGPGSLTCADGDLIPPLTEAIHYNHRESSEGGTVTFTDALGRSGGCQGCHPAHRSDGDMAGYPIDIDGNNFYANADNRDANGGCFVGRDVHSNPGKDLDGAGTPGHLNPVGEWLQANVANDTGTWKGIWCTNCHNQAGQQMWKAENVADLVNAQPGDPGHVREPGIGAGLSDVVAAINASLGTATTEQQFIDWLDPKDPAKDPARTSDQTSAIWAPDPGLCDHVASLFGAPPNPAQDANVATIEVNLQAEPIIPTDCSTGVGLPGPDCDGNGNPDFSICGSLDSDNDVSVNILDFCTTPDCVGAAQATLTGPGQAAVPVPFSAATDGRDHWLAAGEPHCADCHEAPYTEQSGNISAYPPFNYPRKASLMRYTRGHQDITCQGCHESTHGLYPVTPSIDTTTYAQAASLNPGDINDPNTSHGPLVCGTCHDVDNNGIPTWVRDLSYKGQAIGTDFDAAISWMHTFTDEANPLDSVCLNCHGVKGNNWDVLSSTNKRWVQHAYRGRVSRTSMDKVETDLLGHVAGDPAFENPEQTVCVQCHRDRTSKIACNNSKWKNHLIEGRVAESVWEHVSDANTGSTCGW